MELHIDLEGFESEPLHFLTSSNPQYSQPMPPNASNAEGVVKFQWFIPSLDRKEGILNSW